MQSHPEFLRCYFQAGRGRQGGLNEDAALLGCSPVVGLDLSEQVALDLVGNHLDQVHQVLAFWSEAHAVFASGLPQW